ncbi:tail fiber protein [Micromonospora sp. NPDC051006]|uniref:tail fiber protein n=1 Tax=Micromonospora sp. NPDC051006 TaxID=3364283 RepID=UPI0037BD9578
MAADPSPVPIGTITAFAGRLDIPWLRSQGWLYCDGAELTEADYPALHAAIGGNYGSGNGTFRVPDLRGRFGRGVDLGAGRDPYVGERAASARGALAGNNPGSVQDWYTALPATAFAVEGGGAHQHPVAHMPADKTGAAVIGSHYGIWNDSRWIWDTGAHTHTITGGGDAESRPINKYVYFIIKFDG